LQYRLIGFLRAVPLSDLVIPGRRIEVPLEMLSHKHRKQPVNGRAVEELTPVTA